MNQRLAYMHFYLIKSLSYCQNIEVQCWCDPFFYKTEFATAYRSNYLVKLRLILKEYLVQNVFKLSSQ